MTFPREISKVLPLFLKKLKKFQKNIGEYAKKATQKR